MRDYLTKFSDIDLQLGARVNLRPEEVKAIEQQAEQAIAEFEIISFNGNHRSSRDPCEDDYQGWLLLRNSEVAVCTPPAVGIKPAKDLLPIFVQHHGKWRPRLHGDVPIQVKLRDGVLIEGLASEFFWQHCNEGADIVEYRILPALQGKSTHVWMHNGGLRLMNDDVLVQVRLRDGQELLDACKAGDYDWRVNGEGDDIVAWRLVK